MSLLNESINPLDWVFFSGFKLTEEEGRYILHPSGRYIFYQSDDWRKLSEMFVEEAYIHREEITITGCNGGISNFFGITLHTKGVRFMNPQLDNLKIFAEKISINHLQYINMYKNIHIHTENLFVTAFNEQIPVIRSSLRKGNVLDIKRIIINHPQYPALDIDKILQRDKLPLRDIDVLLGDTQTLISRSPRDIIDPREVNGWYYGKIKEEIYC